MRNAIGITFLALLLGIMILGAQGAQQEEDPPPKEPANREAHTPPDNSVDPQAIDLPISAECAAVLAHPEDAVGTDPYQIEKYCNPNE